MFEQGVIRPPSEAYSLLLRVTRNCPWNRCHICPAFKGKKFSKRSVKEVKKDIDMMVNTFGPNGGGYTSAFLQDADTLILPTDELVEIMEYLKEKFPKIERITTYARAKSMKRKSQESYERLKKAGLTRIHSGMESGSEAVLKLIAKGTHPEEIVRGGRNVKASGISLSEYIMPGVGGAALSHEHAVETARVLNEVRPDFIRVRTFAVHPQSPIQKMVDDGTFIPMDDEQVVREIRLLLEHLDEMPSHFRCGDFSLNLLMQVDGRLDQNKTAMIEEIDRYLALSPEQKKVLSLVHRTYPQSMPFDRLDDTTFVDGMMKKVEALENQESDGFNKYIRQAMSYQIPQPQTERWD